MDHSDSLNTKYKGQGEGKVKKLSINEYNSLWLNIMYQNATNNK